MERRRGRETGRGCRAGLALLPEGGWGGDVGGEKEPRQQITG